MANLANETVWAEGVTVIGETQIAPKKFGNKIVGSGAIPLIDPNGPHFGSASAVVWVPGTGAGSADGMIQYRGHRMFMDRFSVHGKQFGGAGTVGIGIYMIRGSGVGTGKAMIGDLYITDCDVGWRNAETPVSGNTDESVFDRLTVENCAVAWLNVSDQSIGWSLHRYHGINCPVHFRFEGGGAFNVHSGQTNGGILFQVETGGPGPRTSAISLRSILDTSTDGSFKLLEVIGPAATNLNILFENTMITHTNYFAENKRLATPIGKCLMTLRGVSPLQKHTLLGAALSGDTPVFYFQDCITLGVTSLSELCHPSSVHVLFDGGGNRDENNAPIGI